MSSDLFDFSDKPRQFAVFGNPIAHSKSPQIHALFAQQFGLNIDYVATLVEPGGLNQAVQHFKASGGVGLNITVPFKLEAWQLADELTPRAEVAEAVNTLYFQKNGNILGDNTDGVGMLRDIQQNHGFSIAGKRVLVVGAGGAVRGVLQPLLAAQPQQLHIVNRTEGKAIGLVEAFASFAEERGVALSGSSLRSVDHQRFDLIINGTAASLSGELPDLPGHIFGESGLAYDMMYANEPTIFMRWAASEGATQTADGLGMLVEQAAESFYLWNKALIDRLPDTRPVIEALRKQ